MYHTTPALPRGLLDLDLDRWLRWNRVRVKGGRTTRRPDRSTKTGPWSPAETVLESLPEGYDHDDVGVGLVMTGPFEIGRGRCLFALDVDGCRDPLTGVIAPWATDVMGQFATYTEVTPSGSGLRMFGYTNGPVPKLRVIPVPSDIVHGDHLRCEIQVFGYGPPGYVTVTGDRVEAAPAGLEDCTDGFSWLGRAYPAQEVADVERVKLSPVGRVPTVTELDALARKRANATVLTLIDTGDWQGCGFPSASEGWFALEQHVIACCADHVDVAILWLTTCTAYGRGDLEDSKDPGRYSSDSWARTDLLRVLGKRRADVSGVFSVIETNGTAPAAEGQRSPFDVAADAEVLMLPADLVIAAEPPPEDRDGLYESVAALVSRDPRPKWLVKGLIEQDSLVVLSGAPGSFKSFLAIDIALALATAQPWHGRKTHACPTLILAGEGHGGMSRRFMVWLKEHHVDPSTVRVDVSRRAGQFLDDKGFALIVEESKKRARLWRQSPGLIIVDTMNRNFGPGDENSTDDVTKFLQRCDTLRRVFHGCTVMVVHHVGHSAKNRSRGASALGGFVDAEIILTRDRDAKTDRPGPGSQVLFRKMKEAEEPHPFWIVPRYVTLGTDEDGEPYGSLVIDRVCQEAPAAGGELLTDPEVQADLDAVLQVFSADPAAKRSDVVTRTDLARRRVEQVTRIALEHGLLEQAGQTNRQTHTVTAVGIERLEAAPALPEVDHELQRMLGL